MCLKNYGCQQVTKREYETSSRRHETGSSLAVVMRSHATLMQFVDSLALALSRDPFAMLTSVSAYTNMSFLHIWYIQ